MGRAVLGVWGRSLEPPEAVGDLGAKLQPPEAGYLEVKPLAVGGTGSEAGPQALENFTFFAKITILGQF